MRIRNSRRLSAAVLLLAALTARRASHGAGPQTAAAPAQSAPSQTPKAGSQASAERPDQAAGDYVVEQITCDIAFAEDGTAQQDQSARIRILSEAGLQAFGVLTFPYRNGAERIETIQIQVRKPDGRVVTTPDSNVQDLTSQVAREAPTYSDQHEKQVPVKALGIGDVIEWRSHLVRTKTDVPGQFWFEYDFMKEGDVREQVLRVTVPAGKYVKVASGNVTPEVHESNGVKVYSWKTSHAAPPKEEKAKKPPELHPHPDVELTTFKSWQEVGEWYGALQKSRIEPGPTVRAQAAQLVAGLTTDLDKQRAIYQFVATKFRYISVSLGEGRYQPHSAEEVLANQYGDCKDKHTLFAALLKAAGLEAWPVLIGSDVELDPDVPSPAQFDHVITFIPGKPPTWLDTTAEVAPYGWLQRTLRDRQALVIPDNGAPRLMNTARELPFAAEEDVKIEAKLAADGTLTGHFDISARGDDEFVLRTVFHETAPTQWTTLAQNMAAGMGYGGTVHDLDVDNPVSLDAPFHYSYNYERKNYSDWANRRISPPLPPLSLLSIEDEDKPTEPVYFGTPGRVWYRATVQLPDGYSIEIPANVKLQAEFADYAATYSVDKGALSAERILTVKASKLAVNQWDAYKKFAKGVVDDESRLMQLVRAGATSAGVVTRDVPEAAALVEKAVRAIQSRDLNTARDALAQAERLNPEQSKLWMAYSALYGMQNQTGKAIDAMKKEIQFHPGDEVTYRMLAAEQRQFGRKDDAVETLRQLVKLAPQNADGVAELASALFAVKKYGEAIEPLQVALKTEPDNVKLGITLVEALVRGGQKPAGLAALAKLREQKLDAETLNTAAWVLADSNTEPALAREIGEHAVSEYEDQLKQVTLGSLTDENLKAVDLLGATWDTLGWAAFRLGDLATAERYINAAWMLIQHPVAGDHLGQVYEREGKKDAAIHAYQLALAVNRDTPDTRERLEKLGGTFDDRPTLRRGKPAGPPQISPGEELSRMRTSTVPELKFRHGTAEFFLLFSAAGIDDVQFIHGDEDLRPAAGALRKAHYGMPFPDQGPEKIARRGILSCSEVTTPSCTFVLLLPANTTN